MTSKNQVYRCNVCGNMTQVVAIGGGELVCCGEAMENLKENTTDAATEKHIPVVNKIDKGFEVIVGSVAHPMEEKHYIEWIELIADGVLYRKSLKPSDEPRALFHLDANKVTARAYCNLHGLWKKGE